MIVLLRLSAGLIGWGAAFCLVYALHGLGCAGGWARTPLAGLDVHRWVLIAAWALSLGATLAIAIWVTRHRVGQFDHAAMLTGWVGFAATIVTFTPVMAVPACL